MDNLPARPMCEAGSARPGLAEPAAEEPVDLHGVRPQVLELLGPSPTQVDDVVRRCQFSATAVSVVLLELELAGRLQRLPGNRVALLLDEVRVTE